MDNHYFYLHLSHIQLFQDHTDLERSCVNRFSAEKNTRKLVMPQLEINDFGNEYPICKFFKRMYAALTKYRL